jgi:hypothetical protein
MSCVYETQIPISLHRLTPEFPVLVPLEFRGFLFGVRHGLVFKG